MIKESDIFTFVWNTLNNDLGKYMLDDIDEDYICPICLGLVNHPSETECCGHLFCMSCITGVLEQCNPSCPLCNYDMSGYFPCLAKFIHRKIKQLRTKCIRFEEGCEWTGTLSGIIEHRSVCDFATVHCNFGCGESFTKVNSSLHYEICPKYEVPCEGSDIGCLEVYPREFISIHQEACLYAMINRQSKYIKILEDGTQSERVMLELELAQKNTVIEDQLIQISQHEKTIGILETQLTKRSLLQNNYNEPTTNAEIICVDKEFLTKKQKDKYYKHMKRRTKKIKKKEQTTEYKQGSSYDISKYQETF